MFDIIALICSTALNHAECQIPTASDRLALGTVMNEMRCAMDGEEHLASVASLIPFGYYPKIICVPVEDEKL